MIFNVKLEPKTYKNTVSVMAPNFAGKVDKPEEAAVICKDVYNETVNSDFTLINNRKNIPDVTECKTKEVKKCNGDHVSNNKHANGVRFNLKDYEGIQFHPEIRWPDLIAQLFLHCGCLYGIWLAMVSANILTSLFALATVYTTGFGITAGAHRLWSHRAYKAKWPLRLLLILLFTVTGQRDVYTWALDHRVHHKYSETVADPHDARRGFFFSHVGWLVLTPHPAVQHQRTVIDVSDLKADPIVMWQKRYYIPLFAVLNIIIPTVIPVWYFHETWWNSFWISFIARFTINLNIAFCVNSVAHMWGSRPYDRKILPVENKLVSIAALGEGWHNYHHVFPWDYKTSELGDYTFNYTTGFIDLFAKLGWAYARKSVSQEIVARRVAKNGGIFPDHHSSIGIQFWGYGDSDMPLEDILDVARIENESQSKKK